MSINARDAINLLAEQTLQKCVPNGSLVMIPNSNHHAIVRKPDAFGRPLLDFFGSALTAQDTI